MQYKKSIQTLFLFRFSGILLMLLINPLIVRAQLNLFPATSDSIGLDYRSGGVSLDSIDASFIGTLNLRPGAGDFSLIEFDLPQALGQQQNGLTYRMNDTQVKPIWSGLPYLGFQYAFGSALNQTVNVQYHQFLNPLTHIHFNYKRSTSNGFLRNSDFTFNDVSFLFVHEKKRYSTIVEAYYGADELGQFDGVLSDLNSEVPSLDFLQVGNDFARSQVRNTSINWQNYLRFIGDSLTGSGIMSRHRYDLNGREYTSQIQDPSLFDTLFIDTNQTRDQYQTASIINGAGVFFNSPTFSVDAALNHRYWRNQNLGSFFDTTEAFIDANLKFRVAEKINLSSYFYFNFLGAVGELKSLTTINYSYSEKVMIGGRLDFKNLYPDPYLRSHSANYFNWNITADQLQLQQSLNLNGYVKIGNHNHVRASLNWTSINNGRYFIHNRWRQDTLDLISVGSVGLKAQLKIGGWSFYPGIDLRFQSANFNYQPSFSTMNRISYSTKIFNDNLGIALGVDLGYDTGYRFLTYNGVLGVMMPASGNGTTPSLYRLNAFTALSIDQFRFFVRADNIDYFVNDSTALVDQRTPIIPFLIRIGITWDFFN